MRFWLLFVGLGACQSQGTLDREDSDGDRYGADEDCDDADPATHPGATEVCDGVDNDCDGTADNGVGDTWFTDADADGYGDPNAPVIACAAGPAGTVDNSLDCDDGDPALNPEGVEICDGLDNDCDGEPDWGTRVPEDYASIQDAIGAASDGEQVCVSAGTYVETIDFAGRDVHVVGLAGSAATVIDGGGVGPVVSFDTKEGPGARLSGFTITGGDDRDGSGIYIRGASPTLDDLVITGNRCTSVAAICRGTGIFAEDSAFTLTASVVEDNRQRSEYPYYAGNQGAGIWLSASSPTLRDVVIAGNSAAIPDDLYYGTNSGGGLYVSGGAPVLDEVTIAGNSLLGEADSTYSYGAGVYLYAGDASFRRVVIADNVAEGYLAAGGGVYAYYATYGEFVFEGSAITNNRAGNADSPTAVGGGLYLNYSAPELVNVDVVGNEVQGQTARGAGMFLTYYGTLDAVNVAVCHNRTLGSVVSEGGGVSGDPSYPYGEIDIRWSNFYDNGATPFAIVASVVGQDGNLEADPRYVSVSASEAVDWDLALGSGSGMIDVGDPDRLDADGTRSDIGSRGGPSGL